MSKDLQLYLWGIGTTLVMVAIVFFGFQRTPDVSGQSANNNPNFRAASSTTFTLTTTSQRLLATSTTGVGRRVAAMIQSTNCTTGGAVYLNVEGSDAVAVANNGIAVSASSTLALETFPGIPVLTDAVQGITTSGTCAVLVTEWISQ